MEIKLWEHLFFCKFQRSQLRFYKYIERDLKKADALIKEIEFPDQKTPIVTDGKVYEYKNETPPMRLAEEDLLGAVAKHEQDQTYKDKHDLGKQIKAASWSYATKELLCFSFLTTFGDGSGNAQVTGKLGPATMFSCTTKDITDGFKKLFSTSVSQNHSQIDEAKKQESIANAKMLRTATTLRAAHARHNTDPSIQAGAALSGAMPADVKIAVDTGNDHNATLRMEPVGNTQPGAKPQTGVTTPGIVLGPHTDFGAQISDKTVDPVGTGASGSYTVDQRSLPKEVTEQDVKQMLKFASEFLSQKAQSGGTTQQFDMSLKHILETQQDNIEAILMSGDAETCMPVIAKQAEILEAHGPAAGRGIGKTLVKVADPRYLAATAYYSVEGGLKALAYILSQSAKLQLAEDLSISNPEAAKQIYDSVVAANEQVTQAFKGTIQQYKDEWHASSGPERTERIFSFLTELAATPAFQAAYLKYCGKACGAIGTQLSKIHLEPTPCLVTPDGFKMPVDMKDVRSITAVEDIAPQANPIALMESEPIKGGVKVETGISEVKTVKPEKSAIKNPEQVVAKQEQYIQTMHLKIKKLEKHLEQKLALIENPKFEKADLEHLFGINKLVKERASGEFDAKYSGFHHDKGWKLEAKGKIEFVTEKKIDPKTGAVKVKELRIENGLVKDKTFFPPEWSRRQVIDKIIEASQNIIKDSIKDGITCLEVKGTTAEGLEILLVIRKEDKFLITAYPVLDNL